MNEKKFTQTAAFKKLTDLSKRNYNPQELFKDKSRFSNYSLESGEILFDYSKNSIDKSVIDALIELADEMDIKNKISSWLNGGIANQTESRKALHTLLRANDKTPWSSLPEMDDVKEQQQRMYQLLESLDSGEIKGCTGKDINYIVNVGIGGSATGVQMVYDALAGYKRKRTANFIINIDPANIKHQLNDIDIEKALFIVSSKSFSTIETLTNYHYIKDLIAKEYPSCEVSKCFYAVTSQTNKALEQGFNSNNILSFSDWVGGRFSLWSSVGLPILLCYGKEVWQELLKGAAEMDMHLADTNVESNIPIIMALISIWQRSFLNINNHAIHCYSYDLRYLVSHLQQVIMESNGKSVNIDGDTVDYNTGEIIWGGEATNSQHSYFQWLHQANGLSSNDFILTTKGSYDRQDVHNQLIAMALGQAQSLFFGDKQNELYSSTSGLRQSNIILIDKLSPKNLGALIALYEHRTVIMAMLWGINPFDQWGVEAGKKSANTLYPFLQDDNKDKSSLDCSTSSLLNIINSKQS